MTIRLLHGDCRQILRTIPDESVHCCVTSPPYWGLRDYGTAKWEGGDAGCDHLGRPFRTKSKLNENWGAGFSDVKNAEGREPMGAQCGKCGARRIDSQIGLEPTPDAYVAEMVAVFREVRRVLRKDGTLWLNLGDSYAANRGSGASSIGEKQKTNVGANLGRLICPDGLKPKDLVGIPWRVAFTLQADGWYLRSDIIWSKPNPMPESVTDRPTKAHEYIFLMSKSERYYYDAAAIAEEAFTAGQIGGGFSSAGGSYQADGIGVAPTGNQIRERDISYVRKAIRNKRSVWEVATAPYSEAHFATFPPALIEPCIKAGCPVDGTALDPFGGAGTTGLVADRLGRNSILIELNPEYVSMSDRRITDDAPLFAQVAAE